MKKTFVTTFAVGLLFCLSILSTAMSPARAEPLPEYRSVLVNDFADMLSEETEATLEEMLLSAREARDHEMTVVTITRLADYDGYTRIEPFAKDLFNKWGVGNAERNDGLMLVVSLEDRRIRLALGSGYEARFDGIATRIIERDMVPEFRAGNPEAGIVAGTQAALAELRLGDGERQAAPSGDAQGDAFETRSTGLLERIRNWMDGSPLGRGLTMFAMALALPVSALLAVFGIRIGRKHLPRDCPECGYDLTANVSGSCPECGWEIDPGVMDKLAAGSPARAQLTANPFTWLRNTSLCL